MNSLYIYNPTCDMAIENGTNSYMPPKALSLFENEISPLMSFLGDENDYLLYNGKKPYHFINFWKNINVKLPHLVSNDEVNHLQYSKVIPWGWSQLITHRIQDTCDKNNYFPIFKSQDEYKLFFSRLTSVKLIEELSLTSLPKIVTIPSLPKVIKTSEDILQLLKIHSAGLVIKTLWSSSGRGILFIRDEKTFLQNYNWINARLKKQKMLIIESVYNKIQDASMQFMIVDGEYSFLGINYFDSDEAGHFKREHFHTPDKILKQLPNMKDELSQLADQLILSMKRQNIHKQYCGPIGIDVLFFTDDNNTIKLYPLIEANLRCNMGLVNLSIKKLLANSSKGYWQISTFKNGEAELFYKQQLEKHPIQLRNNKISGGFIPLTPFNSDTRYAAWGIVNADTKKIQ